MEMKKNEYVVLFPFMAQGHLIPFLSLAHLTVQKGYSTIIINTPLNTANLRNSFPPSQSSSSTADVEFLSLPFTSSDHGLPPGIENTDSLPPSLIGPFVKSTTSLKPHFQSLLSNMIHTRNGQKPLCVVSDFFFGWAADAAHNHGIPHFIFSATGAFGMACYVSMWMNLPHRKSDADEFLLPDFPEAGKIHITQVTSAMLARNENDPLTIFLQKNLQSWASSDGLLLNTVEEVDTIGLTHFRQKFGFPVWAVGPLLLSERDRSRIGRQSAINPQTCIDWLDKKSPDSVVYVSFGSQNTIPASQMRKLAEALDASSRSFIWVVRPPLGFDINAEFLVEEWLPEGFQTRVAKEGRGLIVGKWAPQVEILAHESVGAFISHCGWNSVLEAMKHGVPVIGWPIGADQMYNAKFVVEVAGIGVEVGRGVRFEVSPEEIVEKMEMVMGEDGERFRRRGLEVAEMITGASVRVAAEGGGGSSVRGVDEFFKAAAVLRKEMIEK